MNELSDDALVLRLLPYADSSLIAHLLTAGHGRIHVMARGARRLKNDLRGGLQPLHMLRVRWRRGRIGMATLLSVERGDLLVPHSHLIAAQSLTAIVAGLVPEGGGEADSLGDVLAAYDLLAARPEESGLLAACWWLLTRNGWVGELHHCWICGARVDDLFWQHGKLCCSDCGGGVIVSAGLRRSIIGLIQRPGVLVSRADMHTWRKMVQDVLLEHGMRPLVAQEH